MKKLYIGNLSYDTTDNDLAGHFAQFGAVQSAIIVRDKQDNSSKGFGFVEMKSDDEANVALKQADGKDLNGRNLRVSEARPRESGFQNGGGRRTR